MHKQAVQGCALLCLRISFSFLGHLPCMARKSFCSICWQWTAPMFFPHGKNSASMHPSIQFPWSYRLTSLLLASSSCTMLCDAIPNFTVSFLDQSDETSFHYPSWCRKVTTFNSILFQQIWGNIFLAEVCAAINRQGIQQYPKLPITSWTTIP